MLRQSRRPAWMRSTSRSCCGLCGVTARRILLGQKSQASSTSDTLLMLAQVRVDEEHEPELLWGVRGAGAAFGVITRAWLKLHDVSAFYGGVMIFKDDQPRHDNYRQAFHHHLL